ncbi:hypothetical protein AGMMS49938_09610 [Fibrobacterales bacterium]|nr:hypothetical protein AGMMS49938_09610 [Fibrobacterales bacterium]
MVRSAHTAFTLLSFSGSTGESKENIIRRVTVIGLIVNGILFAIKLIAGLYGGSQSLLADAVHSFSDFAAGVAVLIGSYFWNRAPDEDHPYGHKKIETLLAIGIAISLILAATYIAIESFKNIHNHNLFEAGNFVIIVATISVITKEILYRYTIIYGRKLKSQSLIASAYDHRSDAISSVPVLISVSIASFAPTWSFMDSIGALVVVILIFRSAILIAKPALAEMLDSGATKEICDKIISASKTIPEVHSIHDLRTHYSGGELYIDLHIVLDPNMTLREAHFIGDRVEDLLKKNDIFAYDVLVHLDYYDDR